MATTRFLFKGAAQNLGRFGPVGPGTLLLMTEEEAKAVAGLAAFEPLPEPTVYRQDLAKTGAYTVLAGDSGKTIVMGNTADVTVELPAAPDPGFNVAVQLGAAATHQVKLEVGTIPVFGEAQALEVDTVAVTAGGTGYTSAPTVTFTGGGGSGAAANVATMGIVGAAIADAGTGYVLDEILTVAAGTGTAATLKVTAVGGAGEITGIAVETAGSYSVLPSMTANVVSGGSGTGATINLTAAVATVAVTGAGTNYTSAPTVGFTGGAGAGAAATAVMKTGAPLDLFLAPGAKLIERLYYDGVYWRRF